MRRLNRLVPSLLGVALAVPLGGAAFGQAAATTPEAATHDHKGLFGARHCPECQRMRFKARYGTEPPPIPTTPPEIAAQAQAGPHTHAHVHNQQGAIQSMMVQRGAAVAPGSTGCIECERDAAAMGGTIVPGSIVVTDSGTALPPGRAVVGGEAMAAQFPAGRAVVGAAPEPIGAARASQGHFTPVAGAMAAGGGAPRDPSVARSALLPAQTPVGTHHGVPRPRIIGHLLDIPDLTRIGRGRRERSERAARSAHASVSYGDSAGPVTDLPASMVYGDDR